MHRLVKTGYLLLEDGSSFHGKLVSYPEPCTGEAVFNTSHTGYQEILTDPSYFRQIIVFTAPHIGNVGVNRFDRESSGIQATAAVVRSLPAKSSNWRAEDELAEWLNSAGIPLLTEVNTRAVTLHIRQSGAMRAGIFPDEIAHAQALAQVNASPRMAGADLASEVSCTKAYSYPASNLSSEWRPIQKSGSGLKVAVLDFGVKLTILSELVRRGCTVRVFPSTTHADQILSGGFDGVLISNGPGDPASVTNGIETVRKLLSTDMPVFGICLGHQIIALAAGLKTFKLHFGHRGSNHPVRREEDKTVEITSQNHGFAVVPDALGEDWRITHINLNDSTVEGLCHKTKPTFSIQYHPEASPGPHDGNNYFDIFIRNMRHARS